MTTENENMELKLTNWRHSHGMIFAGTLRIAKEDFDTDPSGYFKKQVFDQICGAMNRPPSPHLELLRECIHDLERIGTSNNHSRQVVDCVVAKLTAALSAVQVSLIAEKDGTCEWVLLHRAMGSWGAGCGLSTTRRAEELVRCPRCNRRIVIKGEKG